jgi:hypothetical protein
MLSCTLWCRTWVRVLVPRSAGKGLDGGCRSSTLLVIWHSNSKHSGGWPQRRQGTASNDMRMNYCGLLCLLVLQVTTAAAQQQQAHEQRQVHAALPAAAAGQWQPCQWQCQQEAAAATGF